jgi:CBS domain-containing protein
MSRHEVDDRDWLELAQSTKVKDLLAAKPKQALRGLPILVDRSATIEETLQLLKDNNILSVPVVDMSGCHKGRKVDLDTFDGFVDVLDILDYLLWHMRLKMGLAWLGDSEREDAKEFFRTSITEVGLPRAAIRSSCAGAIPSPPSCLRSERLYREPCRIAWLYWMTRIV